MKIVCVGRNYVKHAKELGNAVPDDIVLFIKPSTAINKENEFYLPEFSHNIHYELEIVLKINQTIKNVSKSTASNYYNEIALGVDFTARDLQNELKIKGLPWEKAKAFDQSAYITEFIDIEKIDNSKNISFQLYKNNILVQNGNTTDMLYGFDDLVSKISHYFTLEKDDLIFTGTPEGVGQVLKGDRLRGALENNLIFELDIK